MKKIESIFVILLAVFLLLLASCEKQKIEDLDAYAGSKLMIGFWETNITPQTKNLIVKYRIKNVILHSRNIESKEQLRRLTSELRQIGVTNIAVNQEGTPNNAVLIIPQHTSYDNFVKFYDEKEVYDMVHNSSKELLSLGINLNLAPVLDIRNTSSDYIGERSLSGNPETVVEYGRVIIRAMKNAGIKSCAKHFPNNGKTPVDPHKDLPVKSENLTKLLEYDLMPFQMAIDENVDCIMISHQYYPNIDKTAPASFSHILIKELLRDKMKFNGMIISDDFEMGALSKNYDFNESIIKALDSGVDILIFPHNYTKQIMALEVIKDGIISGKTDDR